MLKFIKNKFLFIILSCVVTLVLLIVGAVMLHKDTSLSFGSDGYVLATTTKKNSKYYFTGDTKYKKNADNDITFKDKSNKSIAVDQASFVHYSNGSISFLKKGALVNLADINSSIISYYNVPANNVIDYKNGNYNVSSNKKNISVSSFVGRISDKKYIIAGKNLSLQVPGLNDKVSGDYFEVLFIDKGIVKIVNKDKSYQVTAQDSYVYVGDKIIIDLGSEKIYYDGKAKMLLSQITISGDENIDLDSVTNDSNSGNGGSGSGDGTGSGSSDNSGDGTGVNVGGDLSNGGSGNGNGTGDDGLGADGASSEDGANGSGNGNGSGGKSTTNSAQIEMIKASVTATSIDVSFQLNNVSAIKGELRAYLTNVSNGKKEIDGKVISKVNGTFKVNKDALLPESQYNLTIVESGSDKEKQYFQKTFKTDGLGVSLEREYSTSDSLAYNVIFDENTAVSKVRVSIYDNNGSNKDIENSQYIVSTNDISSLVEFKGLKSNSSYSVSIDTVWIDNVAYTDVYTINRIDTTLRKTPELSEIKVTPNAEEVKFNIKLNKIDDPDEAILSYTYYFYKADDIDSSGNDPEAVYSVVKNDADQLVLDLNQIEELKTGVDYRCKIVAQYNDNEMVREVSTDYSGNFLIKSKPNVTFEQTTATMNKVSGVLKLVDANCSVPINGRKCLNEANSFTLRYYKLGDDETSENDKIIGISGSTLSTDLTFSDLSSNTTYVVKIYGNYYDDDNVLHKDVQIGDAFHIKTDESENLKLKIIGDNKSGENKDGTPNSANVVTFDAMFSKPQDSNIEEEVSSISLKLYSGSYNVEDKLIGSYTITDKGTIQDFFSNYTITNSLFTNSKLGQLNTLQKMIDITNNSTGTLNGTYTVEVDKVLDSTGHNEIKVEDNIYTFKLTPSYYLDSRIETNSQYKYIDVTQIQKKNLTDDEYASLSKSVKNLDDLNDDTVVGLTITNSLSDAFVDSAFTYEKVVVDYVIYNSTTKREIKRVSVDMGNKYQPKTQTIYLDSSELDDGKKYFTRGYDYKVSYELNFTTEKGDNPVYTNSKFENNISIDRQMPIYNQYISKSSANSVTYRYSISDVDNALYDKKLYYSVSDGKEEAVGDDIVVDDNYHDITVPVGNRGKYSIYLNKKNTKGKSSYVEISNNEFESEYNYDNSNNYQLVNENNNILKIKLMNNEVNDRAVAYRVVIHDNSGKESDYIRYFLASRLSSDSVPTGSYDEDGKEIINTEKYIAIDYANISKYMGSNLKVSVYNYYDSGLVGINQNFDNGLILENKVKNRYLNIYNAGSDTDTTDKEEDSINGIYMLKNKYDVDDAQMYLYNNLQSTNKYDPMLGTSYYTGNIANNIGINYDLSFTNNGIVFNNGSRSYSGYNAKKLKVANLKSASDSYKFDSITPMVSLDTSGSTINSIKLNVKSTGVYGQFTKGGREDNKFYYEIYSDADGQNKLGTLSSNITIQGNEAVSEAVSYDNLKPDTTYYVHIYAYLNGKYTRLYDMNSKNGYNVKTYEAKTLGANDMLEKITFSVKPVAYNNESSDKEVNWRLKFKNTDNYKVRFELFDKDGKSVNFDGKSPSSCNINDIGVASDGYVKGCYIQVDKKDLSSVNNVDNKYIFNGDDFVFGGEYYKLVVYAIPYTNGNYDEDNKVILYKNDSLSTTGDKTVSGEVNYNITIPTLEEASFNLNNTLESGYKEGNGYYIQFVPTITDQHYVIKYGKYYATLKNEKGSIIERRELSAKTIGANVITFKNLSANTLYYLELSYDTYRNNNGFSESEKVSTTPFTDFIYTPIDAGITLGTITAQQNGNQKVVLTYNGASNMTQNIVRVKYTISLKGGSSKASGEYAIGADNSNIFTVLSDRTPKLTLDLAASSDTSFTLRSGNTYIISTQYWYLDGKNEVQLTDKATGNQTFTTILNL